MDTVMSQDEQHARGAIGYSAVGIYGNARWPGAKEQGKLSRCWSALGELERAWEPALAAAVE